MEGNWETGTSSVEGNWETNIFYGGQFGSTRICKLVFYLDTKSPSRELLYRRILEAAKNNIPLWWGKGWRTAAVNVHFMLLKLYALILLITFETIHVHFLFVNKK